MFVKTKERAGRTYFFLCIAERGRNNGSSWKATHSTRVDPMFTLAVTKTGAGTGAVSDNGNNLDNFRCGNTCSASLPTGTHVSIVADPDSGSVFAGWGQACSSSGLANECDLTMNANQNATATFDKGPNFFLSADASILTVARGGSVTTNITIIPEAGPAGSSFNSAIALSCSVTGPTPMPSCSFSVTTRHIREVTFGERRGFIRPTAVDCLGAEIVRTESVRLVPGITEVDESPKPLQNPRNRTGGKESIFAWCFCWVLSLPWPERSRDVAEGAAALDCKRKAITSQ
jgi:hypothetical protein